MKNFFKYLTLTLRVLLILAVLTSLVTVMTLEAAPVDDCGDECENDCSESCESCSDCISCLPTICLMAVHHIAYESSDLSQAGSVLFSVVEPESSFTRGIDHPPQLLS